jgi:hypothetical protein
MPEILELLPPESAGDHLVRSKIFKLDDNAREAYRKPLTDWILQKLEKLSVLRVHEVAQFVELADSDGPAEQFIKSLMIYYTYFALTPDAAARDLETFREQFEDAIDDAKRMLKQYPDLVKPF